MGIQLHDYFASRRPWAQLERILYRLPRHSNYKAALEDDEEFAAIALKLELPGAVAGPPRVPLVGYSDVIARLDNVFDAISALHETYVDAHTRKGKRPNRTRAPRPETAQQRLRRAERIANLDSIVEQMTGGR